MTTTKGSGSDYQKSKVYHAEQVFRQFLNDAQDGCRVEMVGSTLSLPPEGKHGTTEDVQGYVDRVLAHPAVIAMYGRSTVTVRKRKGPRKAHYSPLLQEIAVPQCTWALRESVILHELAHHFAGVSGHGPKFAATFLALVGAVMGEQAEFCLKILFYEGEVEIG